MIIIGIYLYFIESKRLYKKERIMKQWEKDVLNSKSNLWLVTTRSEKLLCEKHHGSFLVKGSGDEIDDHYIVSSEKL